MTTTHVDQHESERSARYGFLLGQIRNLQCLEFVRFITPSEHGVVYVEIAHGEQPDMFTVEVGGVPQLEPAHCAALEPLGFTTNEGCARLEVRDHDGSDRVAELCRAVLDGPLAVSPDAPLDVRHGSRRAALELERKLARIRARLRPIAATVVDDEHIELDQDGDLVFPFGSTRVWIGTRALAESEVVVRVFALAAVDVDPTPALGLFLSQANFALAIGKFSLDPMHRVIWFEEALLGESFADDELRRVIELVAVTTNLYDDQIAQMFGGHTVVQAAGEPERGEQQKPGRSGYL